jgi:importin-7
VSPAVVYLKNRVSRGWSPNEDFPQNKPIPEDEKARFRERLLPILASSPPQIRQQLIPVLQKILHYDFPEKWPSFMDITLQLLNTNDAASIFAGLQCLLAICRVYRFKSGENRADFDKIVEATFPRLLIIGTGLVNETSDDAGEMLHIALKAYKHSTFVGVRTSIIGEPFNTN